MFCAYAIFEGFRAFLFFLETPESGAIQKIRWLVFFFLLILVAQKVRQLHSSGVRPSGTARMITRAGALFTLAYAAVSTVAFVSTGSFAGSQYAQTPFSASNPYLEIFATTAYVTCIYIVVIPAAFVCLSNDNSADRYIGTVTLVAVFATLVAVNTRIGIIFFVLFALAYLCYRAVTGRIRPVELLIIPLLAVVPVAVTAVGERPLDRVVEDLAVTLHLSRESNSLKDIDRQVWFDASFASLNNSDPLHALVGYGLRTHGYVVAPYVQQGFWTQARRYTSDTDVSVEGFTAIAVDMGYLGLAMFLGLVLTAAVAPLRTLGLRGLPLSLIPLGMLASTLVANVFDCLLLYLAIMPWGLTEALGRFREPLIAPEPRRTAVGARGGAG